MKCPQCGNDNPENAQFCGGCGTNLIPGEASVGTRLPMVGFGEAISRGFSNYFRFNGRSTRAEYWWWALFGAISSSALGIVETIVGIPGILRICFFLATIIPSLAVSARRLHDINRTGLWLFLWLVPVVGWIVLIVWAIDRGDEGQNQHGPDPRQPTSQQP